MTNQEIIERLRMMKAAWIVTADTTPESQETAAWAAEAINGAISALKGPTREQVEKVRGEWEVDEFGHKCSKCGEYLPSGDDDIFPQFCPNCGDAKTDEAVDMVMERMEALYEET